MRLTLTVPNPATSAPGAVHDVVLEVDEMATVGEVAEALLIDPATLAPGASPEAELVTTGVLSGTVLPRTQRETLPPGTVRLEVVGGPFSGEVVALPAGSTISVGQSASMLLQLLDPALDEHHATIVVEQSNARLSEQAGAPTGSSVPALSPTMTVGPASAQAVVVVNGIPIDEATEVGTDDLVQIGASIVRIGMQPRADADVSPDVLGTTAFNRASRIRPPQGQPAVKLPGEKPTDSEKTPLPWLSALLPMVVASVAALVFKHPMMLLMAAASPLMVIGSYFTNRRMAKRSGKRTVEKWRDEVVGAKAMIDQITTLQRIRAWRTVLDPVSITDVATTPTARLWERRVHDDDALNVRVGVGEIDLDVKFEGTRLKNAGEPIMVGVSPAPVTVNLGLGVAGIAGTRPVALSIARSMAMAMAVTRSPRDLRMVLLCEESAASDWDWWRWLPHADGGPTALAMIGNTVDARLARVRELSAMLEARQAARGSSTRVAFDSHVVVFIDKARAYRTLPGMVGLLEHGPAHGISIVAIEDDRAKLPEESVTEVLIDPADVTMGSVESSTSPCARVLFDGTTTQQAETIARALKPVVHVGGAGDDTLLPQAIRFVDLLDLDLDDPQPILSRWMFRPRETRAVVGAGLEGEFALDLAKDGPHGLVAGTTGAGKSEFLQTFVVSLALANRPDALNFVLVDYKGGSAFADCERLPHTVGLVTNLDGRETERALESLDAELKRREHVLKEMGAKDADTAWEKDPETASARGMARLVLVIDEFAELKAELPDFVTGLVRIARVGRSLGVHLILATQRPSGAITAEMQSNTNLRVALRVTDKADSNDILGSAESSMISASTPGRGYARRGVGAAPAGFQTARVAGRRPGVVHTQTAAPRMLTRLWREVGAPVVFPKAPSIDGPVDHDDTDLRAIVNVITEASTHLGVKKNPSPWLEPLPALLSVGQAGAPSEGAIVLGLEDVPSEQAQHVLEWSIRTGSHLAFIGGARSGRTSTLRMIAAQLAQAYAPTDLHLYGIDYGNAALTPMTRLPHCGAVITPMEPGRLPRFIARLTSEIGARQQVLAQGAYGDINEQRAAAPGTGRTPLPYVAVFIDGWERLISDSADPMALREQFIKLLREGPATGIRLLVAGDRAMFSDKTTAFIDTKYLLPLTDRADYGQGGVRVASLPSEIGAGRVYIGSPTREIQLALLDGLPTGEAQATMFQNIIQSVRERTVVDRALPESTRPFRVDVLPTRIDLDEAAELPLAAGAPEKGIVLGVGGDVLVRYTVDLASGQGLVVAGDLRTGKSTALATIAEQLVDSMGIVVVSCRDSVLRSTAIRLGLPLITSSETVGEASVDAIRSARDRMTITGTERILVIVDDVENVKDSALEEALLGIKRECTFCVSIHLDALGGLFKGPYTEAKKGKTGLLLSPSTPMHGTHPFGTALPRDLQGTTPPGRAVLFWNGTYVQAHVPVAGE